jgi:hypothetical protein
MDTDDSGNWYVVTSVYEKSVKSFDAEGRLRFKISPFDYDLDYFVDVSVVGSANGGAVCALGVVSGARAVLILDTRGVYYGGWYTPSGFHPSAVDCSSLGIVTLVGQDRIAWLTPTGDQIDSRTLEDRSLIDVDTDDVNGITYVVDLDTGNVLKLDAYGNIDAEWSHIGDVPTIAVDVQGNVFAVDFGGCRVVKVSPVGQEVTSFGKCGQVDGQTSHPWGVAVDPYGTVYVSFFDYVGTVQKFVRSLPMADTTNAKPTTQAFTSALRQQAGQTPGIRAGRWSKSRD